MRAMTTYGGYKSRMDGWEWGGMEEMKNIVSIHHHQQRRQSIMWHGGSKKDCVLVPRKKGLSELGMMAIGDTMFVTLKMYCWYDLTEILCMTGSIWIFHILKSNHLTFLNVNHNKVSKNEDLSKDYFFIFDLWMQAKMMYAKETKRSCNVCIIFPK